MWVDFLRGRPAATADRFERLLDEDAIVTCGPIAAELVAGSGGRQQSELWQLLAALDWLPIGRSQWRRVGEVGAMLRSRGGSAGLTDIQIAVAAADAGAELWTLDGDFARIGEVLPGLRTLADA